MGKGNRNRDVRDDVKTKKRGARKMPKWLVNTIAIAVTVVIVLGVVAAVMLSNGTFRRMQILVKSKTGEFDVNLQVATLLAWELEYYTAYIDYYTTEDTSIKEQYSSAEAFAHEYALARVTREITNVETGAVISSPRDAIDNTLSYMVNFVAICDYAYDQGIRVEDDEWKADFDVTWYAGMADKVPVSYNDLQDMMVVDQNYGISYSNLDLFLGDYFGRGMKEKDMEKALKMICLYEKCLASYTETLEDDTRVNHMDKVDEYIKKNPQYFYTVEYLSQETDNVELAKALKAAKSPEEFKTIMVDEWLDTEGNYKDTFNAYVTMKKAEEDLESFKDLVDNAENEKPTAWTDQLAKLGAVKKTYTAAADKKDMEQTLSKWLFSKRNKFDEELVKGKDKFYVFAMDSQTYDEDGDVDTVTVYQLTYDVVDGTSYEGDNGFKAAIRKHLLAQKELTDEKVTTTYKTALQHADAYVEAWKDLTPAQIEEKMKSIGSMTMKKMTENTTDAKAAVKEAVFDGDGDPVANTLLTAEEKDTLAYVIYVKTVTKNEGDVYAEAEVYYVEVKADVFYDILTELSEEVEKKIPASSDAYYSSTPTEKTYQYWMFNGANAENNFKSPIAANATEYFTTTVKDESGVGEDTEKYTAYFVVEPLHLDRSKLVNGGYFSYVGNDANAALNTLAGKTGDELIAALQALSPNSTNVATVSETISEENVDAELAKWLFDDKREANDRAIVKGEDGKTYIAVYLSSAPSWQESGVAYYVSQEVNTWMAGLSAGYEVNQRVLNRVGDPTPEAEPQA